MTRARRRMSGLFCYGLRVESFTTVLPSKRPRSKSLDREYKSSDPHSSSTSSDVDIIPFYKSVANNDDNIQQLDEHHIADHTSTDEIIADKNKTIFENEADRDVGTDASERTLHSDVNIPSKFDSKEIPPQEALSLLPAELDTKVLMKQDIKKILSDSSITNPTNIKSSVTCNYYTTEITVKKNDVVRIIYQRDDFVYVQNKKGASGFIPLTYCSVESSETLKDDKKRRWSLKDKSKSKCDTETEKKKKEKGRSKRDKDSEKKAKNEKHKMKTDGESGAKMRSQFYIEQDELHEQNSCSDVQVSTDELTLQKPITECESDRDVTCGNDQENPNNDEVNDVDGPLNIDEDDCLNEKLGLSQYSAKVIGSAPTPSKELNVDRKIEYCDTSSEQSERIEKQESGFSEISESTTDISETNQEQSSKTVKLRNDNKGTKKLKELILKKKKIKKTNTDKKTVKMKKLGSTKLSVFTESQIDWYSNLFNDVISDSSDSGDELDGESTTDAESMDKSTKLRFEMKKQEFFHKKRLQQRRVSDTSASSEYFKPLQTKQLSPTHTTTERVPSTSGFAAIRKTKECQPAEVVANGLQKNRMANDIFKKKLENQSSTKTMGDGLMHAPLVMKRVGSPADVTDSFRPPSSLSSESPCVNRIDRLKFIQNEDGSQSDSASFNFLPDERKTPLENRIIPPRPFSSPGKEIMLVSYDFIAADDSEVTILSGQQVEVINRPDDDWWLLRTQDGREGLAPRTFLAPVPTVPSRKPNLLRNFHSSDANTDGNNNIYITYKNHQHKATNPVHLPSKYISSESPRLAKVAPFVREHQDSQAKQVDEFYLYKKQTQNQHNIPPPSYDQHIMHKQHKQLMDCFYETASDAEYQAPVQRSWKSQEQMRYIEPSSTPPRLIRRKSFSGRQKRVRFSNEVENHSRQSEDHFFVARQYGLDNTQIADEENEVSTWC